MKKSCFDCVHAYPSSDIRQKVCKAKPPQVVAFHIPGGTQCRSLWPQVAREDFCDSFELRAPIAVPVLGANEPIRFDLSRMAIHDEPGAA